LGQIRWDQISDVVKMKLAFCADLGGARQLPFRHLACKCQAIMSGLLLLHNYSYEKWLREGIGLLWPWNVGWENVVLVQLQMNVRYVIEHDAIDLRRKGMAQHCGANENGRGCRCHCWPGNCVSSEEVGE
jgi:hypothetical protein